jgi:hypothetical protein
MIEECQIVSATMNVNGQDLRAQLAKVELAASKLITRLSDRAAYATPEEFDEIRGLIKALRGLGGKSV